jgi:hypothetical protein
MDEGNRAEWIKEKKMKSLSGLKGCKRMVRQIIRQERQARHDTHAGGQKTINPLASGVAKRCVRCAAPWAKRYVPGSKESGVALPEQTTKSGLTCPPHRSCWVALYYNTALQANKKRPTHSKLSTHRHRAWRIEKTRELQSTVLSRLPSNGFGAGMNLAATAHRPDHLGLSRHWQIVRFVQEEKHAISWNMLVQ